MALKYVVTKQVFGFDKSKTEKYVARLVVSGQVSFSRLCTQVGQICGAHRGTVQLVIAGLVDALINNPDDGKSVQLCFHQNCGNHFGPDWLPTPPSVVTTTVCGSYQYDPW